jgi:hypothetical protein
MISYKYHRAGALCNAQCLALDARVAVLFSSLGFAFTSGPSSSFETSGPFFNPVTSFPVKTLSTGLLARNSSGNNTNMSIAVAVEFDRDSIAITTTGLCMH